MRNPSRPVIPALATILALTACAEPGTVPTPAAAEAPAPACLTSDLEATVTLRAATGTSLERTALVTLINVAGQDCTVDGWLTVTLATAGRRVLPVPTTKLDEPAPAHEFVVRPHQAAYAGLRWTSCARTEEDCHAGGTLRYDMGQSKDGPAAVLADFPTSRRNGITMNELRIGSLQQFSDRALDW
ncbi:hypothetical protein Aca07nite_30540 [Actinoplanes capillaceus]|uniref:DUF4232 domain-containing protein n=1 Tax=Actinoplanes campanulatus TaxID=113559 RepID=A0ABQ3WHR4_9ACTN|nr:DUF4232 domain-containing protein [Actinoplanes capillaceus]GID45779.1 hypothetical protein Aca07nite_30540 [Actinoplanes capillaceus]